MFKEQSAKTSALACLADCNDRKQSYYAENKGNMLQKGLNDYIWWFNDYMIKSENESSVAHKI